MSEHTPGPWIFDSYSGVWHGRGEESELVCSVEDFRTEADGGGDQMRGARMREGIANARLIAAAPDLLAACKAALGAFERNDCIDWSDLERAIAKAESR